MTAAAMLFAEFERALLRPRPLVRIGGGGDSRESTAPAAARRLVVRTLAPDRPAALVPPSPAAGPPTK